MPLFSSVAVVLYVPIDVLPPTLGRLCVIIIVVLETFDKNEDWVRERKMDGWLAYLAVLGVVLLAIVAMIAITIVCLLFAISRIVVSILFISILAISVVLFAVVRLIMRISIKFIVDLFECVLILLYK